MQNQKNKRNLRDYRGVIQKHSKCNPCHTGCLIMSNSLRINVVGFILCSRMCMHAQLLSCVLVFATPCTAAHQAPLSLGFSRQEYWSGLPFPSPGDLPDPGIKPMSPALTGDSFPLSHQGRLEKNT